MQFLVLVLTALSATALASPALDEFTNGNQLFTANVYREAVKNVSGNFLICPFSAETVLALTYAAARGETAVQMQKGLSLPLTKAATEGAFKELLPTFMGNELFNLSTANKIFVQQGFKIDESYRSMAAEVYDAGVDTVDFGKSSEAAGAINHFVENQTNNKIHDLVSPDDLSSDTRLVLVNALYFMGEWVKQFEKYNTAKAPFHVNLNDSAEVDTMHMTDYFNYYESAELKAKFLELPFSGTDITLTIVLPNEIDGLPKVEERLSDVLRAPKYSFEKVKVALPKFKIESTIQLNDVLKNLGIVKPFEIDADFSGFGSDGLYISKVIQKTFIDLNEDGVEAAAATAGIYERISEDEEEDPNYSKDFIVNRPFSFYLHYNLTNIFIGRYVKPSTSN